MTYASEALILMGVVIIIATTGELVDHGYRSMILMDATEILGDISLWVVFIFRFYYISIAKGFKHMLQTKRVEMFLYLLFATNEYPFYGLTALTGISWEPVQALWNRLTLMMCLLYTIKHKFRSNTNKSGGWKTGVSHATPSKAPSKQSLGPVEHQPHTPSIRKTRSLVAPGKSRGPSL